MTNTPISRDESTANVKTGEGWQPIETARSVPAKDADQGIPVLLANAATGNMRVAVPCVFTADDGVIRHGAAFGFGIWIATHWQPLPAPPRLSATPATGSAA